MKASNLINLQPQRKPESIAFLEKRIVHPGFKSALQNINMIHATRGFVPRGMMFVGETGVGKTTILEYYRELYCTENGLDIKPVRGKYPVLLIRLQADSGKRSFLFNLCVELGITPNLRETVNDLERRAITLLKNRGVELVLLDEFHHLASRNGKKNLESLGDLLKNLMDLTKIPFVLAGTLTALTVLENHPELQRRFAASTRLFNLSLDDMESSEKFQRVLGACQKNCGIPCIKLNTDEMLERFLLASRGRIGVITAIIETAINMSDSSKGITMEDLKFAFEFCRADPLNPKCNPFEASSQIVKRELGRAK
ncbi:TniB family NTP-binding protein [Nitrincola schmidtii]|uniref:TniB family NTP-binding protein n=1 Tax=Nitrincola schmidtii TaxID=1730894 RepID=UPI0014572582|nr:TniB family NTP-binding protein [Nitrincola schmidtii]